MAAAAASSQARTPRRDEPVAGVAEVDVRVDGVAGGGVAAGAVPGVEEGAVGWVAVVGEAAGSLVPVSWAGGLVLQRWASGTPRPGVGSNGSQPTPSSQISGQAWASRPNTWYEPDASWSPHV